ncbi:putative quinol monooxygenase [Tenacibaculum xiamenense]|uniref:putative quinol monooxygenase n=1 Tax=Tenacibaculum xiamenense TaxID=1261553 RepID=UPI0038B4DD29
MDKKVILEFKVKSEKVKKLMDFLEKNLENVRTFEGCSQVKVYYNTNDKKMIFDEVWKSVVHHQKYLNFITKNGVMEELGSFLEFKPEIKYFDIVNL